MALKVHNRIQETNSDSMIDAREVYSTKPSPNPVSETSQYDENHSGVYSGSGTSPDKSATECDVIDAKYFIDHNIIGEGHHGSVRQCINRTTGKYHAVKSICKSAPSVNIKGIQREVSLLKSLKHDRILRLDDVFEDAQYVHLVTELCSGGELFDAITKRSSLGKCFSEHEAARIMYQLLDAVSYLHKNNVVHRDIKPENILFETREEDSDIKLIDFGLSRKHKGSREAPMSTIVGTPYYLAPEVLGQSYTQSCDLWSVGIIVYILLCGYPPFNGANNKEVYAAVQRGIYYFPTAEWQHISHAAKDFIIRLLQVDPRGRISAEEALRHPWIAQYHLDRVSMTNVTEHQDQLVHIVNDDSESCSSFVEVVLDGAVSLHNENIVCGGICTSTTHMHY